jgi:hypothetical protein
VQLTILYCYINGNPVYITLKKTSSDLTDWEYRFHLDPINIPKDKFVKHNFGKKSHPSPSIEDAVSNINRLESKPVTGLFNKAKSALNRQANKLQATVLGKDSLTKSQAQNLKNNNGQFDTFYNNLLDNFHNHINLQYNAKNIKMIITAFKTIGDQMYLFDSILLAQLKSENIDHPWVITIDTFLKDYIIYTKSANVMCTTKFGNKPGQRKLTVYLKPKIELTGPEKEAAEEKKQKAIQKAFDDCTKNKQKFNSNRSEEHTSELQSRGV